MKTSYLWGVIILLVTGISVLGYAVTKTPVTTEEWTENVNEISGYKVSYPSAKGSVDRFDSGADGDGYSYVTPDQADKNIYHYTDDMYSSIGTVYCPNTEHLYDNLSNELTTEEYATRLFEDKQKEGVDFMLYPDQYEIIKSYSGAPSYSFVLIEKKLVPGANWAIIQYVVAENSKGIKCTISYHLYDKVTPLYPNISAIRAQWIMSFLWLP